ncbi:helix-turn-helix transcriptional regulator [Weissella confusa]|uniref:helix-turn-helix transcriptional regulator n=1 Tax=Weissella confusa TaxID=1583 RepID=UPI0022E3111D|nr:helix-turn-helix transcriptional regulator [Weissella confusa]
MKIGENIQLHREQHGMSQQELADKLGVTRQSISKWENDTALPSFKSVLMIGDVFNLSLDELVRGDDRLIEEYEHEKGFNLLPTEIIVFSLVGTGIIGMIMTMIWPNVTINDWPGAVLQLAQIVAFIGFVKTAPWGQINQMLKNRKVFVWLVLWLSLILLPYMVDFFQSFVTAWITSVKNGSLG